MKFIHPTTVMFLFGVFAAQSGGVKANVKLTDKISITPPPEYMLQLYTDAAYNSADISREYGADAITAVHEAAGRKGHFTFKLPEYNHLVAAEFHVHHSSLHFNAKYLQQFNNTLFEISVLMNRDEEISRQIVPNISGWFKFRLNSEALKKNCSNYYCVSRLVILTVHITKMDGESIHLRLHHGDVKIERKPLLILFTKENKMIGDTLNELQTDIQGMNNRLRRSLLDSTVEKNNCSSIVQDDSCSIQTMMVSFSDIGWDDWIIAPSGFNAYTCSGGCSFPLSQDFNPTNHAIAQSLMTIYGNDETSRDLAMPHCTPSSYLPLTILYYNQDENVILRNYEQMIVGACGCR